MTYEDVELEELPLFRGLPAPRRTNLLRHAMVHGVPSGTVLFEQGDVPNFQLIVLAGSAHLFGRSTEGREVLIEAVRAPDLIIPAAVLTGAPYLMQARVPEPSRFLLIHAAAFRAAVEAEPLLAHAAIGSLAAQFRRMVRQIKNLKLRNSIERVGCYLLALSKRQGTPDRAVLPFEKTLIASELGITRESFSRALSSLGKSGIRVDGQMIEILDATRLAAVCAPDPLIDETDGEGFPI
ncbi:helix-turn-helix domain-containing protein [Mesorhizobium sp. MSK_1335]|uniref:Helix-turn-helix domain-containing protein n=1 Tax=Mesorhizobium montanum TaxID=3072323 RepID=A0ABU4ZSB9_9HYPH|nr:helix-turn-helix domain-containing protein [Mesorhizobium sp. MSK_1335]MDX8528301.1 helix-turn-helix domain-containing protein [Mesorhizobium sp. MSK_1335]